MDDDEWEALAAILMIIGGLIFIGGGLTLTIQTGIWINQVYGSIYAAAFVFVLGLVLFTIGLGVEGMKNRGWVGDE